MVRGDNGLAFLLQYENVAWYEDGKVRILDRRIYPIRTEFVTCTQHGEVAQAIADMVTQSAGPYLAAGMGMALAAYECRNKSEAEQLEFLEKAAYTLSHARPTTVARMADITGKCFDHAKVALAEGKPLDVAIFEHTVDEIDQKYRRIGVTAEILAQNLPQNGTVLTQCFGETIVGLMIRESQNLNKNIKMFCSETRPYFQGARLTASVAADQGVDVTVISDNMPAYCMQQGLIDVFTSAADAITLDGHVVNKVGTLQKAIVCKHFGIPYFATGAPDRQHPDIDSVKIEMRDPNQVLEFMGTRVAKDNVKGLYPAFDATPPHLISGIVTNKGLFSPYDMKSYFK